MTRNDPAWYRHAMRQIAQIQLTLHVTHHVAADLSRLCKAQQLRALCLLHAPPQRTICRSVEAVVPLR